MALENGKIDVMKALSQKADHMDGVLRDILSDWGRMPEVLSEAIGYTLGAPGKRVRAAVVFWSSEIFGKGLSLEAEIFAAAVEMVHTYSLIHDDLPAMDDDDFRRGKPSCHKAFDEATAILAGDALLTMAFEILAKRIADSSMAVELIKILAFAAGPEGMIAGQVADMQAEKSQGDYEILKGIHINKTARMFEGAALGGAVIGRAGEKDKKRLGDFGLKLGLCFQIADDILDVMSSSEHLGKTVGKDAAQGKLTYPSLFGLEKSKELSVELGVSAIESLQGFGHEADILRELTDVMVKRTR